jgi:uncharacterized membrane protein
MSFLFKIRKHPEWLVVILAVFFALIHLLISIKQSIDIDETYTLNTTRQDLGSVIHSSLVMEMQPPLYFAVLKIWRVVDDSILWARIFSILCMSFSILAFYRLSGLAFEDNRRLLMTVLFALNPFTFWAAQEIRVYALAIFLVIIQNDLFFRHFLKDEYPSIKIRIILVIISLISVLTNIYLAIPLIANFILLFACKQYKHLLRYIADMALPVILILLVFWFMPLNKISHFYLQDENSIDKPLNYIYQLAARFNIFLSGLSKGDLPFLDWHNAYRIIGIILYAALFYRIYRQAQLILSKRRLRYIGYLFIIGILLILMYFIVKEDAQYLRHSFYIYPALLLAFSIVMFLNNDKITQYIVILLLFTYTGRNWVYYSSNRKSEGLVQIKALIENKEESAQSIFFYRNMTGCIFRELYQGKCPLFYLPKPFDFGKEINFSEYVLDSEQEIDSCISRPSVGNTIWLVNDYNKETVWGGTKYNYALLDQYFDRRYKVVFDSIFANEYRLRKIILQ